MTQAGFAGALGELLGAPGLTGEAIEAMEDGTAPVTMRACEEAARLAGVDIALLLQMSRSDALARDGTGASVMDGNRGRTDRRNLLRSGALLGLTGITSVLDRERLSFALDRPSRVDAECLQQMERTTVFLQKLEGESRRDVLLGPVHGHLLQVMELLRGSLAPETRRRLCSIAGETAGVAGWLTWQADNEDVSSSWFQFAIDAASEAGNRTLGAYLVGCLATQPHYRESPGLRLQRLASRQSGFTQAAAAPATRAWLATMEAEAHALMGRAGDAFDGLRRAEHIMAGADAGRAARPSIPSSFGVFFNATYLAAEEAVVRVKLGHHQEAVDILEPLLSGLDPDRRKNWYWLYPMLASSYIKMGNVTSACRFALETVRGTAKMQVATNLPLVLKVRAELDPFRMESGVQQLDDAIDEAREAV
jgi:hypothetical protein